MKQLILIFTGIFFLMAFNDAKDTSWIRINQLGYTPAGIKVAVWCSKENKELKAFQLVSAATKKIVFTGTSGNPYGTYGPFRQTFRLNFSKFTKPGKYYLQTGGARSPEFSININVFKGTADFCLRYMRQQRSGFNPFLKDSCHTHDGYTLYGEEAGVKDSTFIDVSGGWHDASDYLQYSSTSANATYHLLAAYRDFPKIFSDEKNANGLEGRNNVPDILDEARWGLEWLLKMHPSAEMMFNQLADDRDHQGMRIPKEDSFYGKGFQRPVYFINGELQQRGKLMNNTTGTSSTAAKFASAFALGSSIFQGDDEYGKLLRTKAKTALRFAKNKYGVTQTVSVRSPYIYAEDNWVDDMELAFASLQSIDTGELPAYSLIDSAIYYASQEPVTPWLGDDTAKHYQWYPFINLGHFELAKQLKGNRRDTIVNYYQKGIQLVWDKARQNAFYRGVPFIWCSNNLTTSFAIQCHWYKQLSGDNQFDELAQANFDWLFGANPWGTSMVYGLPGWGDTPTDPHSAFTHLKNYPIDGGLVDGPVSGSIYKNLLGITLYEPDEYELFQSDLAVYHDDYGDYSTNEPTMDGTAALIYLLAAKEATSSGKHKLQDVDADPVSHQTASQVSGFTNRPSFDRGAMVRGGTEKRKIALIFSGDEFAEGGSEILSTLNRKNVKASFFFTGNFYRQPKFKDFILQVKANGHYLGAHSDKHILYCDWSRRDSLLVAKQQFETDLLQNYQAMKSFGIEKKDAPYFLPPYEWYNDTIASWTRNMGLHLINYTLGTLSQADYTTPKDKNYKSSEQIYSSIINYQKNSPNGLNGFMLLMHTGAGHGRSDKFFKKLPALLSWLHEEHYEITTLEELLKQP
jgi:peptidoglycan/xylan/chitin deacetylase (PgdA/CDA1 family)